MRPFWTSSLLFSAGLLLCFQAALPAAVITFEGLPDSTIVTNQFSGLTFSNTQILTAGISLNEFEVPPRSGVNVASDNGGPISIMFSTPVSSFAGYFTYTVPLTLKAFNAASAQIATKMSLFSNNLACLAGPPCSGNAGSSPNELLQVSFGTGFSRVTITGDPAGGSFALDDATITSSPTSGVPEPASAGSVGISLLLIAIFTRLYHAKTHLEQ